jgi:MFS family permease
LPLESRHDPYAALRIPNYRWYVLGTLTLTLGIQIQGTVVAWQVYALTHDPLALGMSGLAEVVPFIGTSLFAGHVADTRDRRKLILATLAVLLIAGLSLLGLSIFVIPRESADGNGTFLKALPIYSILFITGIARSFLQPARNAFAAELVPRELYPNSVAWRSTTWQTAAVAGPALGGLLYGYWSATVAYAVQVVLLLAAIASILAISGARRDLRAAPATAGASEQDLLSGIRFVFHSPVLLGAMTLDLFSVFLGGAEALMPVFAREILHVGPQGLGALRAAPAAGAVIMSVYLAHRRPFEHAGRTMLATVGVFALCIIIFGLSTNFWLSLAVLALSGMADQISVLIRSTLLQVLTPEHMLGRVSSVNSIFVGSSNELGAFESGVMAKLLGTVRAVVLGGLMSLAVVGIVAAKIPTLRKLRRIGA